MSIRKLWNRLRDWNRRRIFREGRVLSRFIACDVRRDILVVSSLRVHEGLITGRIRTSNVLYASKGLVPEPKFGPEEEIKLQEMWRWTGKHLRGQEGR